MLAPVAYGLMLLSSEALCTRGTKSPGGVYASYSMLPCTASSVSRWAAYCTYASYAAAGRYSWHVV
jgi:hypothetical protein